MDRIVSPPDSEEQPTLYIRGAQVLRDRVEEIGRITAGNLVYIGEWHSHPDGSTCSPSDDDYKLFDWLDDLRKVGGLPPLMLFADGQQRYGWHLGEMVK